MRREFAKREILISLFKRSIKNLSLSDFSYIKQVDGQIRLKETKIKLVCGDLELRNRLFQEDHARDCQEIEELRRICSEETNQARQARIEELSTKQQRNPSAVSQMKAQIRDLQNRANSLSDARALYDPESGSSSGATHVPDQTSMILSSRTLPRCDSGLPRNTQNCTGIMGNVLNDHLIKKDYPLQSSTIQRIWHLHLRIGDLRFQRQQGEK